MPKFLAFEIHNTRFYSGNSIIVITYKIQTNLIHGYKELHNTKDVMLDKFHEKSNQKVLICEVVHTETVF